MAPYRIGPPPAAITAPGAPAPPQGVTEYTDKLIRLIPGDVVAAYLTVKGIWIGNNIELDERGIWVVGYALPLVGLALTILLRIWGTPEKPFDLKDVQWNVVLISSIAFLIWVSVTQDFMFGMDIDARAAGSFLVLFTFLPPFLIRP